MPKNICKRCKWFDRFDGKGYCHRYAPTPLNHERGDEWTFPIVEQNAWYGEFKAGDPTKELPLEENNGM